MTSNIDKLNQIAPLLAGREFYAVSEDEHAVITHFGLCHSLVIDDVYPDSEPIAYFRVTEVKVQRQTLVRGGSWEETWETVGDDELPLPIKHLENIEVSRGGRVIAIQFFPRGVIEEITMMFRTRH